MSVWVRWASAMLLGTTWLSACSDDAEPMWLGTGGTTGGTATAPDIGAGGSPGDSTASGGAGPVVSGGAMVISGGATDMGGAMSVTGGAMGAGNVNTMGGMPGQSGGAASGGTTDPGARMPPCVDDPSQVVVIGDSFINWITHTLPADLTQASGQEWRLYAVGASSMASGGVTGFIPDQFELAVTENDDIKVVVMDGGGNDVLLPDVVMFPGGDQCKNSPQSATMQVCKDIVQAAIDGAREGMDRMAEVGVSDIVYFFYPHVPEDTWLASSPNAILDYALPLARETCEGAADRTGGEVHCHFVDMVPVFEGRPELFAENDLHPNPMGSAAMAEAIWGLMTERCVSQPSSSGCCTP